MLRRNNSEKPIIVLVHGAFAESSSWDEVIPQLQDRGYTTIAAANPLRSLSGDAEFVASIINNLEAPVVLVGHSYGGSVITKAAMLNEMVSEKVKALVYAQPLPPKWARTPLPFRPVSPVAHWVRHCGRFPLPMAAPTSISSGTSSITSLPLMLRWTRR